MAHLAVHLEGPHPHGYQVRRVGLQKPRKVQRGRMAIGKHREHFAINPNLPARIQTFQIQNRALEFPKLHARPQVQIFIRMALTPMGIRPARHRLPGAVVIIRDLETSRFGANREIFVNKSAYGVGNIS